MYRLEKEYSVYKILGIVVQEVHTIHVTAVEQSNKFEARHRTGCTKENAFYSFHWHFERYRYKVNYKIGASFDAFLFFRKNLARPGSSVWSLPSVVRQVKGITTFRRAVFITC